MQQFNFNIKDVEVDVKADEDAVYINGVRYEGDPQIPMHLFIDEEWGTIESIIQKSIDDGWISESEVAVWMPIHMRTQGMLPGLETNDDNDWIIQRRKDLGLYDA